MRDDRRPSALRAWSLITALTAAFAFTLKIVIALKTYGTNDVLYFERFLATLRESGGIGLYHRVGIFNHPPFMVHALRTLGFLASVTEIPFAFWLRLPAILADVGSVYLVWKILEPRLGEKFIPAALVMMAAAPASVMISGFHGNTDPAMIFLVLLSIYLIDRQRHVWLAGAAFGASMNIKVVPLIFMPAIFLYLPCARKRMEYFAAVGAVFVAGSLPYILQDPVFIAMRIFGYKSIYAHWGVSRLMTWLPFMGFRFSRAYAHLGRFFVLAIIIATSLWMNRFSNRSPLFLQCGLVAFMFMSLTPGFGVQYLAWLVPWVVGLGLGASLIYYVASGVFLFLVYNFWSQGFPWYLANSDVIGDWRGHIIFFELLCWVSVVVVLLMYFTRRPPLIRLVPFSSDLRE